MKKLRKIATAFHSTEMDGELVMIHGDTGKFFALKDVGLHVWNALDGEEDMEALCLQIEKSYDVDSETCRSSVQSFADQLVKAGFAQYF